jgi:hypothetical protein
MASERVKLLFDENISQRLVEFVNRESGLAAMAHINQRGWSGLPDRQWIEQATQGSFVIITSDRNERTRGYTVEALKAIGARVILLGRFWDHLNRWERAKWLIGHIERLVSLAQEMPAGSVYLVNKSGRHRSL